MDLAAFNSLNALGTALRSGNMGPGSPPGGGAGGVPRKGRGGVPKKACNCKNSKCLKLYCECFASGRYCEGCNCTNCYNNHENEHTRQSAVEAILERNPNAFRPKIQAALDDGMGGAGAGSLGVVPDVAAKHSKGCNCKKSACLKKYCECFQAGVFCSDACKCVECKNFEGSDHHNQMLACLNMPPSAAAALQHALAVGGVDTHHSPMGVLMSPHKRAKGMQQQANQQAVAAAALASSLGFTPYALAAAAAAGGAGGRPPGLPLGLGVPPVRPALHQVVGDIIKGSVIEELCRLLYLVADQETDRVLEQAGLPLAALLEAPTDGAPAIAKQPLAPNPAGDAEMADAAGAAPALPPPPDGPLGAAPMAVDSGDGGCGTSGVAAGGSEQLLGAAPIPDPQAFASHAEELRVAQERVVLEEFLHMFRKMTDTALKKAAVQQQQQQTAAAMAAAAAVAAAIAPAGGVVGGGGSGMMHPSLVAAMKAAGMPVPHHATSTSRAAPHSGLPTSYIKPKTVASQAATAAAAAAAAPPDQVLIPNGTNLVPGPAAAAGNTHQQQPQHPPPQQAAVPFDALASATGIDPAMLASIMQAASSAAGGGGGGGGGGFMTLLGEGTGGVAGGGGGGVDVAVLEAAAAAAALSGPVVGQHGLHAGAGGGAAMISPVAPLMLDPATAALWGDGAAALGMAIDSGGGAGAGVYTDEGLVGGLEHPLGGHVYQRQLEQRDGQAERPQAAPALGYAEGEAAWPYTRGWPMLDLAGGCEAGTWSQGGEEGLPSAGLPPQLQGGWSEAAAWPEAAYMPLHIRQQQTSGSARSGSNHSHHRQQAAAAQAGNRLCSSGRRQNVSLEHE